ncbi:MAG TPA: type II toxin-antitoxin system HicA family toxin [Desulfobacteria bacterium]|nr:type II toxin-antitoxin system HicA family toxin [Desulfobacteria bacterium]
MQKIKPLPAKTVIKALEKIGFKQLRQKGSHLFMRHPVGRTTLITVHPGEDIGKGMIRKIISDAKLTRKNGLNLLNAFERSSFYFDDTISCISA